MTILDAFIAFTKGLTGEKLQSVEADLAALMEGYSERYGFTPEELAEIDRRVAEPHPRFAGADEVERIFGKRFSA
jgi:hypothetical protein